MGFERRQVAAVLLADSQPYVLDNRGRGLSWVNDGRGYFTFRSPW